MIKEILKKLEKELNSLDKMDFNFLDNKDGFDEIKTLNKFKNLFNQYGYSPLIAIYFLLYIQLVKNPLLLKEINSYDVSKLYIKLNDNIIRLSKNLEDCLYFLESQNVNNEIVNIQKQKISELINELNIKISEYNKWSSG